MEDLPKPNCPYGYPTAQVAEIMGDRLKEFNQWMNGQTIMLCDGNSFDHENKVWTKDPACSEGHGAIYFIHDVYRFFSPVDEFWD